MVAWERSKICCTPSATVDLETKVCLLPTVSAVMMVLFCKHMMSMRSYCQEMFPCPVWGTGGSGFGFKQDPMDVFRFASKNGYTLQREKCKNLNKLFERLQGIFQSDDFL